MDSRSRKRSRSPPRKDHDSPKRRRSNSPHNHPHRRHHHHHHHHHAQPTEPSTRREANVKLPFKRQPLSKHDLKSQKPLLASYLSIQKGIDDISELEERELKGRWKSFVHKWNEGVLAMGWYDPETSDKVQAEWRERDRPKEGDIRGEEKRGGADGGVRLGRGEGNVSGAGEGSDEGEEEEGDFGPMPHVDAPGQSGDGRRRKGPVIPTLDDLQVRREDLAEDDREQGQAVREERKLEKKMAKERLDELVPRAEAGSRERMLEKKREKSDGNRAFREAREGGGIEEVGDGELMGGDEGIDEFKKKLKEQERVKNEREIRREEVLRARAAEREERMEKYRAKERATMSMLQELARQRFGGGD